MSEVERLRDEVDELQRQFDDAIAERDAAQERASKTLADKTAKQRDLLLAQAKAGIL